MAPGAAFGRGERDEFTAHPIDCGALVATLTRKMPAAPRLNLIVLRALHADALAHFYSALGLSFSRHRHGTGPEHYAHEEGPVVFEIYPAATSGPTQSLRLGFSVDDLTATLASATATGATLVTPASESPWGLRAVIADPEGHRVELTQLAGPRSQTQRSRPGNGCPPAGPAS